MNKNNIKTTNKMDAKLGEIIKTNCQNRNEQNNEMKTLNFE